MSVKTVLKAARKRIERGWTQERYARTSRGHMTASTSPNAVCWCAVGAINAVGHGGGSSFVIDALEALDAAVPNDFMRKDVISYNDALGRTQQEILALFDKAIAACD